MGSESTRWEAPPLSSDVSAIASYRVGVAALVSGGAHASHLLTTAIALDPGSPWPGPRSPSPCARGAPLPGGAAWRMCDQPGRAPAPRGRPGDAVRRRRRARDLRREHLLEFPGDVLIVWLPVVQHEMGRRLTGNPA